MFLPRDVMHKRFVDAVVCPSVMWILSKRVIVSWDFSHQTILVFVYQTLRRYSDGDSPDGGVECRWLKSWFWTNILLVISNCCTVVSLSHLVARFLLTAGIGWPSTTRYKQPWSSVTVYGARPPNTQSRSSMERCVWQQNLTVRQRQQNRIELYALVNPMKPK